MEKECTVEASFLEVYGEDVYDLLDHKRKSLPLREDSNGVSVVGLSNSTVDSTDAALNILKTGTIHRTTASTLMNTSSSRSHAVFTVMLSRPLKNPPPPSPANSDDGSIASSSTQQSLDTR